MEPPQKASAVFGIDRGTQPSAGQGHRAPAGSFANPPSIDRAARCLGRGLGALAVMMGVVKGEAPRVQHGAPHDPAEKRSGGWSD